MLVAEHIKRSFGAVAALVDASLRISEGEILAVVGDNGAGKSTLLKVLSGVVIPDSGRIVLDGVELRHRGPQDALDAGIETVYQDLALVDTMAAYQNIYLGREAMSGSRLLRALNLVDDRTMRRQSREVLERLGVKIPSVSAGVKQMSGGQRQCLAIARAVLWGRRIVILDEPTAALGVRESAQVLDLVQRLKEHGVSVILVTHNMQHMMEVADRVTVMRLGRTVADRVIKETSSAEVVGLITGAIPGDAQQSEAGGSAPMVSSGSDSGQIRPTDGHS